MVRFGSVDAYLDSRPERQAATLRAVIGVVLDSFPELAVKVAWNVPQVHRGSDYVFGVSAANAHLALALWSADVIDDFRPRLAQDGYVVKKNLFQVPNDWSVDEPLLVDLVRARLAELDGSS